MHINFNFLKKLFKLYIDNQWKNKNGKRVAYNEDDTRVAQKDSEGSGIN
jgi:hypothetical protein